MLNKKSYSETLAKHQIHDSEFVLLKTYSLPNEVNITFSRTRFWHTYFSDG